MVGVGWGAGVGGINGMLTNQSNGLFSGRPSKFCLKTRNSVC